MSRARSVPAFMVEKSAPWMNGTASAKARKESVGKPGSSVDALRPPELTSRSSEREDERRDRRSPAGAPCARPSAARARRPASASGAHAAARPRPLSLAAPSSVRPGLGEEDVVERRRVQLEVVDRDAVVVERADDVGEPDSRRASRTASVAVAAERLAEAARAAPAIRGAVGVVGGDRRGRSAGRSPPSAPAGVPSATIVPWSMIPTRSASTSASSRYCVVRKTVTPSSWASRATSSQRAVRLCGSSPVVGSSRKRIRGPVHEREREVEAALHPARVAAAPCGRRPRVSPTRSSSSSLRAACARPAGSPAASSAGAGARGRSAAGRARPPGARRRSRSAPSGPP